MASATVETFCCMENMKQPSFFMHFQLQSMSYNIVCIISSVLGMMGAVYQILPSERRILQHQRSIGHTQRSIINWLAFADFFAATGILFRSVFWLWKGEIVMQHGWTLVFCGMFAFWIRFFYNATYMWTFFYAIDVNLVCKQKQGNPKVYHSVVWFASSILTLAGLGSLYLPDFKCHNSDKSSSYTRALPNYLLSYTPIVLVMIVNPILYFISSKNVKVLLTGGFGQLTYIEQNLLDALREKFFSIVLVFYVCWSANVLNGILLWLFFEQLNRDFMLGLWYFMAVVNPLQAVLNSLVYKGWDSCKSCYTSFKTFCCCCCYKVPPQSGLVVETTESSQQFLLDRDRTTFSTNNLIS